MKLKDLVEIKRGSSPRPIIDYLSDKGYKWLKISDFNLGDKYISETKQFIKESGLKGTRLVKKGTLVLTNSATPGIPIFLDADMCLHDGFLYFKNLCDEELNMEYLYCWLLNNQKNIVNQANGSVFKNLKKEIVENLDIELPNFNNQNKIVKIYNTINDKIIENTATNNNLYEIIKTIFKNEFSNINNSVQAQDIADITIGKTPPRNIHECFTTNDDDIKWVSISDLGKCGMYLYNTNERLTKEAVNKYNVKIVPKDTIVLSFKLTIGRIAITNDEMATNEAIAHFNLKEKSLKYYIYCYLKDYDYGKLGSTSSIATAVNSKIIKAMPIDLPYNIEIERFNNKVIPMFKQINENESENEILIKLRDTLLPKLMNGEIDLENIEI